MDYNEWGKGTLQYLQCNKLDKEQSRKMKLTIS